MGAFLLFLFEIILLFFLSREVTKSLSRVFLHVFHSSSLMIHVLAFLFLPGVIIHELSHFLMASILFVPTGEIEFLPEVRGSEVKMGSVAIASTDPFRRFLIGVAPLLIGFFVILLLFWYIAPVVLVSWQTVLLLYGAFEVSNTMFSSKKDMEGALGIIVLACLVALLLLVLHVPVVPVTASLLALPYIVLFFTHASWFFGVVLGIDFVCWGAAELFLKLLKKH